MQYSLQNTLSSACEKMPPLEAFATEIDRFTAIQDGVQALPANLAIGWIRVDTKPIKQALLTWTSKWIYLYTRHLRSQVGGQMLAVHHV